MLRTALAGTSAAAAATAVIGSVASAEVTSSWYEQLDLPAIQPPGPVFGVVWTALYTDIAVAAAVVVDRLQPDRRALRSFQTALGVNLVLNAAWCSFAMILSASIWRRNR